MKNLQENLVDWFEIPTTDITRAQKFYETVFEMQMSTQEMGPAKLAMFPAPADGKIGATGTLMQTDGYKPSTDGTVVYLYVENIEKTLDRINSNGGKTLLPKTSIGEHGFMAHFQDCEGNRIALHATS